MAETQKRLREDTDAPEQGHAEKKRRRQGFAAGDRGIFYTTMTPRHERDASRSLMRALDTKEQKSRDGSIAASLAAEADELRERPFSDVGAQATPKGTGFLKFNNEQIPSKVVESLFARIEKREEHLRFVCRVLPMDFTCKPHFDDFVKIAEEKVKPVFDELRANNGTWALEFRSRNCTTIKKDQVLKTLDQWSTNVKASLGEPTMCILVEVNPLFCGVSVVPHWGRFKKYNASLVAGETQGANASKKATAEKPTKEEGTVPVTEEPKKEEGDVAMTKEPTKDEQIPATEEPKKEEGDAAMTKEPTKDEQIPATEEPKKEEGDVAMTKEPTKDEQIPATEEPKKEEGDVAMTKEPTKDEQIPATEEPKKEEKVPATEEPKKEEEVPATEESTKDEGQIAVAEEPAKEEKVAATEEPKKEENTPEKEEKTAAVEGSKTAETN